MQLVKRHLHVEPSQLHGSTFPRHMIFWLFNERELRLEKSQERQLEVVIVLLTIIFSQFGLKNHIFLHLFLTIQYMFKLLKRRTYFSSVIIIVYLQRQNKLQNMLTKFVQSSSFLIVFFNHHRYKFYSVPPEMWIKWCE